MVGHTVCGKSGNFARKHKIEKPGIKTSGLFCGCVGKVNELDFVNFAQVRKWGF